ncbi:MAG: hypothetical protein K0B87_08775 [Candidatus Syntrophosphaera sp.]|nr:hypothetical protein [Candidatus Syntrophosphaera sp.]
MLTIDWKDRLKKDTVEYLEKKLPKNDYDFEIIYIAYPERINGKIPSEVIVHVAKTIVQKLGKNHEKYIPFYKHIWEKKGENGKMAFIAIMGKITAKKPAVYIPLLEGAMKNASAGDLAALMEKVMLPLLRKQPEKYLPNVYAWTQSPRELLRKQAVNLLVKLLKKDPGLSKEVVWHFVNQWLQPLGELAADHVALLKAVAKLDEDIYLDIWRQHDHSRDPQSAEILCSSLQFYHPEIEKIVEVWTKSGNARLKKAAVAAQRLLHKKKAY